MTSKTQLIFCRIKRGIEFRRIGLGQHPEIVTAMRQVATAAIILFDGPVKIGFVLDLVNKCREHLIHGRADRLVMAGHAERHGIGTKHVFDG